MKLPSTIIGVILLATPGESASVRGLQAPSAEPFGFDAGSDLEAATDEVVAQSWANTENLYCRVKRDNSYLPVGTTRRCALIVPNIKAELANSDCTCKVNENGMPKWDASTGGSSDDGEVNAQFIGNIVGHAKMLCQIVEAIDCWKEDGNSGGGLPNFPGFGASGNILPGGGGGQNEQTSNKKMVAMTLPDGSVKFASFDKVFGAVKKICGVIDGGVGSLPGLLDGFLGGGGGGGGSNPISGGGIPNLFKTIIGLIGGGGGGNGGGNSGGGNGGGLLDGLFGSIFVADGMAISANQIALHDGPNMGE